MRRDETYLGKKRYKKLLNKKIAIVGVGSIGSFYAMMLGKIGVKNIILIDRDVVEKENIATQILYDVGDVGKPKVQICEKKLLKIDKDLNIETHYDHLDFKNIGSYLEGADLIIDGTDNLRTRFLIDEYCKKNGIKWIYNSVIREEGYSMIVDQHNCFSCVFKDRKNLEICSQAGVMQSIIGLVVSFGIGQITKILLDENYDTELYYFNITENKFVKLKTNKRKNCKVCKGEYPHLEGIDISKIEKLCGGREYIIYKNKNKKVKHKQVVDFGDKVLIKAKSKGDAESIFNKLIGEI